MKKHIVYFAAGALTAMLARAAHAAPSAELGAKIYTVETAAGKPAPANSCMYCHGISGEGGAVAAAAKLDKPKDWKSFKALGGEAEFKKDPAGFLKKFEEAISNVILVGSIRHNLTYKNNGYDLKKAGGQLNAQMLGLTGAPSMAYLKKNNISKEDAVQALVLHVKTLDKQGVFKK